jgi:ADP-ribose pyrophosphatase YjhB (NUDIX family)
MKEVDVAVAFIQEVEKYYFQHRDGSEQSGAIGLTGLFGGKLKPGESFEQAIYREVVLEEAEIYPPPAQEDFKQVDRFSVEDTEKVLKVFNRKVLINVRVHQLLLTPGSRVVAKEGTLVQLQGVGEVKQADEGLSPVAKKAARRRFEYGPEHN